MFSETQREAVRQRVLELARADARVMAGALTGSMAFGSSRMTDACLSGRDGVVPYQIDIDSIQEAMMVFYGLS